MKQVHSLAIRVYWEDTDAGGIVYHASHVRFFERGRTELLRDLGVSQSASLDRSQPDALLFTARRMTIDYLKPAHLDDILTVETSVREARGARIVIEQALRRGEEAIATAVVEIAATNGEGRPRRIPPALLALLTGGQ